MEADASHQKVAVAKTWSCYNVVCFVFYNQALKFTFDRVRGCMGQTHTYVALRLLVEGHSEKDNVCCFFTSIEVHDKCFRRRSAAAPLGRRLTLRGGSRAPGDTDIVFYKACLQMCITKVWLVFGVRVLCLADFREPQHQVIEGLSVV